MNEILQILLSFILFFLIITVPLNIFNTKKIASNKSFSLDVASFNLIINCNILLLISILPISLGIYNSLFIFSYLIIFIYIYFIRNFKFNLFRSSAQPISIFFIIFFIISINVAVELNLGWDAKFFYYIKALFFVENQHLGDLTKFAHNSWHPHLGSFFWAFFWNLMPIKLEYFGRLFYIFLFCFSIFYICHNNFKNTFIENVIFILIIIIFYTYERFSGLPEILIFSFLVITSKYFSLLKNSNNTRYILFILLACNLIIWLKSEGIVYATILVLLLNLSSQVSNKIKIYSSVFYISMLVLKIIIYKYFNFTLKAHPFFLDYILNLNFDIILYKLKFILPFFFYYSFINVFFISGLIILLVLNFQRKINSYVKLLNYYFIFNIIYILCTYFLIDAEIEFVVRTTMERLIFTSSGFYVFLIVTFVKNLNKNLIKG